MRIRDSAGNLILTADLGDRVARIALEYDGAHHLERAQRDGDSGVAVRLAALGWTLIRVTHGMLREPTSMLRLIARVRAAAHGAGKA